VAKLEPFIVQPISDSTDVELFLEEVAEEQRPPAAVSLDTDAEVRPDQNNLNHFMEFLSRRKKKNRQKASNSKIGIALERYERQKAACQSSDETELAELAKFTKSV
jgi:hypothetical protein